MKNIHVLPTDKPSRLLKNTQYNSFWLRTDFLDREIKRGVEKLQYQNIYITSDEESKEGDWCLDIKRNIIFQSKRNEIGTSKKIPIIICTYEGCYIKKDCKKIILTTDQDLIKDGVQPIDDMFLKFFIQNPSCEEIEVETWFDTSHISLGIGKVYHNNPNTPLYKIILPKEEPKQLTDLEIAIKLEEIEREESKQETLEEAAERLSDRDGFVDGALFGAKWQAERMYSEEDMFDCWKASHTGGLDDKSLRAHFNHWFKKFKNK
jgi:hypothetical protein